MRTISGELQYGIEYDGEIHYEVELRLPLIGDNIEVLQEVGAAPNLKYRAALFARCLLRVGSIPGDAITTDLIVNHLVDDDFDALAELEGELKKKLRRPKPASPTIEPPSSSSDDMASRRSESGQ
ncbi:hypothetical protein [Chromobacterium subtsugae]|uniref:hypothetical protein n=1 Tax=Chromobacterium subtsugae TaxID=251747 RepID=UPI00064132B8|nr:hypothetical protein [Chromobacterium subtsugae]